MPKLSMEDTVHIAMWSGPRNISTAMMRSWGNRCDTFVCDEPLYAHYLRQNPEVDHPGRGEVLEHHETDWRRVVKWLGGPVPRGKRIFYQKHMAHHLLPEIDRTWLLGVKHAFLIREPREMLTSLIKHMPHPHLEDTGLPQQVEIINFVRGRCTDAPILDVRDVLEDPRRLLGLLCDQLGVPFDDAMLSWAPGRRPTDGIWAKYWYGAVEKSTCFRPYKAKGEAVPEEFLDLLSDCDDLYEQLSAQRLR